MEKVKRMLERYGLHSFLLPFFFIVHNYMQYYGLVSVTVALQTLLQMETAVLIFFLLLLFVLKHAARSFQLITMISFVLLFYGVIKDFFSKITSLSFLASYSVLLPVVAVVTFLLAVIILRKRNFLRINLYQNLTLIILVVFDLLTMGFTQNSIFLNRNLLVKQNLLNVNAVPMPAERPDVYYLVFDCYPGTSFLKDYMQFDNRPQDDTLKAKGFRVLSNPKSNYNRTAFSMASALNFEYLSKVTNTTQITPRHYSKARLAIQNAVVPQLFSHLGYKLYNLSIFELNGQPPLYREDFLTLPERSVLLYNTLWERCTEDILWNFISGKYAIGFLRRMQTAAGKEMNNAQVKKRDFNNKILDSLAAIPGQQPNMPKFVYAHFYLPHPPFFYQQNGTPNNVDFVVTEESLTSKPLFLSYLQYTNTAMLKMIDTILYKSAKPPVIIIQSDHGFRDFAGGPKLPFLFFKNYTAFYFPDRSYGTVHDTLSNVNTFPLIFNKYFDTHIPLQQDTSTFLLY